MDVIYTDSAKVEQGFLQDCSFDFDIGDTNDFEVSTTINNNVLVDNAIVYVDNTELGGIVKRISPDTTSNTLTYGGYTWRGILSKRIISPPSGSDYYTINGPCKMLVTALLSNYGPSTMFRVDASSTDFTVSSIQFNRYCTLLDGIITMLSLYNKKLVLRYADGYVNVGWDNIADYSDEIEISDDLNLTCKIEKRTDFVNHLICLGKGDLKDRQVVHLYADVNGNVSSTKTQTGIAEVVEVYDYSSVESLAELTTNGTKELINRRKQASMSVSVDSTYNLDIGDIVSGYERITSTSISRSIVNKIVQIDTNGNVKISYKVGDK